MMQLPALLDSWNTADFESELKQALKQLDCADLPLKQVANFSGLFAEDSLQFSLLGKQETERNLTVKLSVFFQEISNQCPCSGAEPETMDGHCEMQMTIDKSDGSIGFAII